MIDELFARRQRMQKKYGPRFGGLFEFLLFSGLILGVFALLYGAWYGIGPLVLFGVAYAWLDSRRQAALAAGGDPALTQRRYDRAALIVLVATSMLGAVCFYGAMRLDAVRKAQAAPAAEPPPPPTLDLDIVR